MPRASIGGRLAVALLLLGTVTPATLLAATESELRSIEGRVLDADTGEPLSDVAVSVGSRNQVTDREGRFRLAPMDDSTTVTVHRIGYRDLSLHAADVAGDLRLRRAPVVMNSMEVTTSAAKPRCLCDASQLSYATVPGSTLVLRGASSLAEGLETAEGVSSSRPGSWGAKAFVRGLGGERVVVLLDGNRLYRACNVGMDGGSATISPEDVERVEILAGPGSTLYGSGNLGGVINVVTREGPAVGALRGELRAVGSTAVPGGRVGASLAGNLPRASFRVSADGASFGDQRSPRGTIDASSYRDLTIDGQGSYRIGSSRRLDARVERYAGRDIGYPGAGAASIPEEDRALYALDYGWQRSGRVIDGMSAKLFLQSVDHHMTMTMLRPSPTPGGMPMRSETDAISATDTWGARLQARLAASPAVKIDTGAEAVRWSAEGSRWVERTMMGTATTMLFHTWPGVRVSDLGIFAQAAGAATSWFEASAGARLDRVLRSADGFERTSESVASGNAGLQARHASGLYVRAGIGFGYRVPDPTELFGILLRPDGFVYVGDPTLRTETSRNVEVSAGVSKSRFRGSVTAFRNRIDGYISTFVTGDSISTMPERRYGNIADARIEGVTGNASGEPAAWLSLRATASYTRGENRRTGEPLPQIAPLEGVAGTRFRLPGGGPWIEPEVEAAASQARPAVAQGEVGTPGYCVWNLRAGGKLGALDLTVGAENLFDRSYRRHLDPPALWRPGRNFFGRVVRRF